MNNEQTPMHIEPEMVNIRKFAIEIASQYDKHVVGVSNLITNADAIRAYILSGELPPVNTVLP